MVSITIHFEFAQVCALAHLPWLLQEQRYSFGQLQALGSARKRPSPVLAIEHVPDHFAPLCVHFGQRLALLGAHRALVCSLFGFGRAALRAAIRKSRLIGPQFELFPANHTCFDRKTHSDYFIEARFSTPEIRMTLDHLI